MIETIQLEPSFHLTLDWIHQLLISLVVWGWRKCTPSTSALDMTLSSDGEALVLELWGMWSTPYIVIAPWSGNTLPFLRVLFISQIELFNLGIINIK